MQTRDQIYAATVYEQVATVREKEPEYKKYGAMAHKLPLLIRTAGLVQALAFVEARGKEIQKRLLTDLKATVEPEADIPDGSRREWRRRFRDVPSEWHRVAGLGFP